MMMIKADMVGKGEGENVRVSTSIEMPSGTLTEVLTEVLPALKHFRESALKEYGKKDKKIADVFLKMCADELLGKSQLVTKSLDEENKK